MPKITKNNKKRLNRKLTKGKRGLTRNKSGGGKRLNRKLTKGKRRLNRKVKKGGVEVPEISQVESRPEISQVESRPESEDELNPDLLEIFVNDSIESLHGVYKNITRGKRLSETQVLERMRNGGYRRDINYHLGKTKIGHLFIFYPEDIRAYKNYHRDRDKPEYITNIDFRWIKWAYDNIYNKGFDYEQPSSHIFCGVENRAYFRALMVSAIKLSHEISASPDGELEEDPDLLNAWVTSNIDILDTKFRIMDPRGRMDVRGILDKMLEAVA